MSGEANPVSLPAQSEKRVFLSGVFDMQNFGDLLFPLVAAHRLSEHGISVVPVAPTASESGLPDAMRSVDIAEMMSGGMSVDAIVIGGGYLIHSHRMDVLREYQTGDVGAWAGPGLWLGATLAAALRDIPVAWNAPGVPHPLAPSQRPLVDAALDATSYVSLRDRGGAELLAARPRVPVAVVPDPIADLARMWPRRALEASFRTLLERKGFRASQGYFTVHYRNRSVAGRSPAGIAADLERFAGTAGLVPILTAVGRAHNDDILAQEISQHLRIPHIVLDDVLSLREMAAAIAFSRLYVGASLHGYITAAAYGVPGVLVAKPAYRKFAGFLEHTGRMEDLARDWPEAYDAALARKGEAASPRIPEAAFAALDRHWSRIAAAVSAREAGHLGRQKFLSTFLNFGLKELGPAWALGPIMHRAPRFVSAKA